MNINIRLEIDAKKSAVKILMANDNGINRIEVIKNLSAKLILLLKIFEILLMTIIYLNITYFLLKLKKLVVI